MKIKLTFIVVSIISIISILLFSSCILVNNECDGDATTYQVANRNEMLLENFQNLSIGDTLWIKTLIPKLIIDEDGITHQVNTNNFSLNNYNIEITREYPRLTEDELENSLISDIGTVNVDRGDYNELLTQLVFNDNSDTIENRFGFIINRSGNYEINLRKSYRFKSYKDGEDCIDKNFTIFFKINSTNTLTPNLYSFIIN